jgi:hypothetical protein
VPRALETSPTSLPTVDPADAGIWVEPTRYPVAESADEVLARLERYAAKVRAERISLDAGDTRLRATQAAGAARSILIATMSAVIVVASFVVLDRPLAWCVVAVLFSVGAAALVRRARWAPAVLVGAIAGVALTLLS